MRPLCIQSLTKYTRSSNNSTLLDTRINASKSGSVRFVRRRSIQLHRTHYIIIFPSFAKHPKCTLSTRANNDNFENFRDNFVTASTFSTFTFKFCRFHVVASAKDEKWFGCLSTIHKKWFDKYRLWSEEKLKNWVETCGRHSTWKKQTRQRYGMWFYMKTNHKNFCE